MNNRKTDRRKVIGPGTIAMIVGIVAFGAYSIFSQPSPAAKASFLSDASGKVIRAEPRPVQAPPLWKPEPELLRRYQA